MGAHLGRLLHRQPIVLSPLPRIPTDFVVCLQLSESTPSSPKISPPKTRQHSSPPPPPPPTIPLFPSSSINSRWHALALVSRVYYPPVPIRVAVSQKLATTSPSFEFYKGTFKK